MIIFPAVDIKNGRCVRLRQGKKDEVTIFSDDPVKMALHWQETGARWLHVVDLDGAFEGRPINAPLIREMCSSLEIPVQIGGGIRGISQAEAYLEAGVKRIIIGTLAMEGSEEFKSICREFPGRVGVSVDAENGMVKSRGWVKETGKKVVEILGEIEKAGASFVVYTDISRDGMQSGINYGAISKVLSHTSLPVIVAGGVRDLNDIIQLYPLSSKGLEGVITGRAIYEGTLDLREALHWVEQREKK